MESSNRTAGGPSLFWPLITDQTLPKTGFWVLFNEDDTSHLPFIVRLIKNGHRSQAKNYKCVHILYVCTRTYVYGTDPAGRWGGGVLLISSLEINCFKR
jgi:hypothetical protein